MSRRAPTGGDGELFFTLSLDMVCMADGDGYFTRVNPAFVSTLGHSEAELLEHPFLDFVHPDDVPATLAEMAKLAQGQPTIAFQNRYRCKDGSYKWLSWRSQPAPDGTQYAIARDITEQQRLLRELHDRELEARAANSAKSMFLAAMSHEIRTPLIGVLGMLEVLGRSKLDAEQRRQFNIVQQSAHSLLEIIGDILDYSKIEAGKVELEPETASVRDLLSRVVSGFSASAESKGLQLTQVIDPHVAAAHVVDGVRLVQILSNFVGNAIKFTRRGSVVVAVHVTDQTADQQVLRFTVSDTGIGIKPERLERLFQPFTQAEAGTTRRFGGTGLGLVICRRLAELMAGTVRAESEYGWGTVMVLELRLPVGDPKAIAAVVAGEELPVATRPKPTREQAEREGSLLLLAEDHPVNREVLTGQLNLAGFFVDTAPDGTSALERFGAARYGLVLTDLHMPGLDGYQLTAAIREFEQSIGRARTPILALTADVLREHVERCLASGMDDYLSKPVTIRQLVEKLRQWLPQVKWEPAPSTAGTEAVPPAQPPVDPVLVRQFSGGDADKARQLLTLYCRSAEDDLRALDEAERRGNGAIAGVAHRIKGAALMIGAREVATIAQRIERSSRGSGSEDLAALADDLRQALARVQAFARETSGAARPA
jgi:two-component system sensor histidine kinase EvgS